MKLRVYETEIFPAWALSDDDEYCYGRLVEVPDDLVARYRAMNKEMDRIHKSLEALYFAAKEQDDE